MVNINWNTDQLWYNEHQINQGFQARDCGWRWCYFQWFPNRRLIGCCLQVSHGFIITLRRAKKSKTFTKWGLSHAIVGMSVLCTSTKDHLLGVPTEHRQRVIRFEITLMHGIFNSLKVSMFACLYTQHKYFKKSVQFFIFFKLSSTLWSTFFGSLTRARLLATAVKSESDICSYPEDSMKMTIFLSSERPRPSNSFVLHSRSL